MSYCNRNYSAKADGNGYIVKGRYGARNMDFNSSDYALSPTEISEVKAFETIYWRKIDLRDVVPSSFMSQPYISIDGAAVLYLFLVQGGRIMSCSTFIHQRCLSISNAF